MPGGFARRRDWTNCQWAKVLLPVLELRYHGGDGPSVEAREVGFSSAILDMLNGLVEDTIISIQRPHLIVMGMCAITGGAQSAQLSILCARFILERVPTSFA